MAVTYLTTPIEETRRDPPPRGSGMTREGYTKRSGAPTDLMIRLRGEKKWRRLMIWQFSNIGTLFVRLGGKPHVVREEMIPREGREGTTSHAVRKTGHAARKSPAQLDREIAEYMANPKLGDKTWEREWSELLTERHSKARMPTVDEMARALRYVENEYVIRDGRVDMEQWAEGLAFGRYAGDAEDKRRAKEMLDQVSAATWLRAAERANYLAREQGEAPRYVA